jgi:hypothetical protein
MSNENLDNIRHMLLYDKMRTLNSKLTEDQHQCLKAMTSVEWAMTWEEAGAGSYDDLIVVHDMLWPDPRKGVMNVQGRSAFDRLT